MNAKRTCVILGCNEPTHCTNRLCYKHHAECCTAGGVTSPGHNVRKDAPPMRVYGNDPQDEYADAGANGL